MLFRRFLVGCLVVAGLIVSPGTVPPVGADALIIGVGAGGAVASAVALPRQVTGTIKAEFQHAAGIATVSFQCEAVASPDPASTGITACSVGPINGIPVPNNLPGAVSTAVGAGTFRYDGGDVVACVGVTALFILDGSLGTSECAPLLIVGA